MTPRLMKKATLLLTGAVLSLTMCSGIHLWSIVASASFDKNEIRNVRSIWKLYFWIVFQTFHLIDSKGGWTATTRKIIGADVQIAFFLATIYRPSQSTSCPYVRLLHM